MGVMDTTGWTLQCLYILVHLIMYSDCATFNGLDVQGVYSVHNKQQCQRLCWYRTQCTAFSYHGNQSGQDNCILHDDPVQGNQLLNGWTMAGASTGSPSNACAARPCQETEVCVPMGSANVHHCLLLPVDCGTPEPLVSDTVLNVTGSRPGDVATMTCKPGYVMVPSHSTPKTLKCNATGAWEAQPYTQFTCEQINCEVSEPLINNTILNLNGTHVGDVATMTCEANYVMTPHNATTPILTCTETGQWVPQQPLADFACDPIDCGIPQTNVSNAAFNLTGKRISDVATMTCEPNYVISPPGATPPTWQCGVSGEWVLQTPNPDFTCQEINCGAPKPLVNNTVLNWTNTRPGDVATMTCHSDYVVLPVNAVPSQLVCGESGEWMLKPSEADFFCHQVQFHNITGTFLEPLPWDITDGWEACVIGTYSNLDLIFDFLEEESQDQSVELSVSVETSKVSWSQKTDGNWESGWGERDLGSSPYASDKKFHLSFRLSGDVLHITVHNTAFAYQLNLVTASPSVDLGVVNYFSSPNGDDIDYVGLISAQACM